MNALRSSSTRSAGMPGGPTSGRPKSSSASTRVSSGPSPAGSRSRSSGTPGSFGLVCRIGTTSPLSIMSSWWANESSTVKKPSTSPCRSAISTRAVEHIAGTDRIGAPRRASIAGTMAVGVLQRSAPKISVRGDGLERRRSS